MRDFLIGAGLTVLVTIYLAAWAVTIWMVTDSLIEGRIGGGLLSIAN